MDSDGRCQNKHLLPMQGQSAVLYQVGIQGYLAEVDWHLAGQNIERWPIGIAFEVHPRHAGCMSRVPRNKKPLHQEGAFRINKW